MEPRLRLNLIRRNKEEKNKMSERYFFDYDELIFNDLYQFILECSEQNFSEFVKDEAKNLKEKIDSYYSVVQDADSNAIRIGWFDNELHTLVLLFLLYTPSNPGIENHFKSLVEKKLAVQADPNSYIKYKIKHFSDNLCFLRHENEELKRKSYSILSCIGENVNQLQISYADFPCRQWAAVKELKTKNTEYYFRQSEDGWEITRTTRTKKDKKKEMHRIRKIPTLL